MHHLCEKKIRGMICALPVWVEARSAPASGSRSEPQRWGAVGELAGVQTHQVGKPVLKKPAATQEPKRKTEEPHTNLHYFTLFKLLAHRITCTL